MKRIVAALGVVVTLTTASLANANVAVTDLYVGRLGTAKSCFIQVDLKTVEQNMFNGQETLRVGGMPVGDFGDLKTANAPIAAGKSVLFGSPAFVTESGAAVDVSLTDENCQNVAAGVLIEMLGSFGPVSSQITLKQDFSELDVVGLALSVHLEQEKYRLKSLTGEKEIGGTTPSASSSSGGGSSSGGSSSGAPTTTNGGSASNDSSCSAAPARQRGGLFALGLVAASVVARLRRRRR